jgi:excinuclease ABC subunit B
MSKAIEETNRRRKIQNEYNQKNNILPKTIIKNVRDILEITYKGDQANRKPAAKLKKKEMLAMIKNLEKEMAIKAKDMKFEEAAELRDLIFELKTNL